MPLIFAYPPCTYYEFLLGAILAPLMYNHNSRTPKFSCTRPLPRLDWSTSKIPTFTIHYGARLLNTISVHILFASASARVLFVIITCR